MTSSNFFLKQSIIPLDFHTDGVLYYALHFVFLFVCIYHATDLNLIRGITL